MSHGDDEKMRNVRALVILGLVAIVTMIMVFSSGCSDNSKPKEAAATDDQVTEQTPPVIEDTPAETPVIYTCPNHPDQTSTDPDAVCPICGTKMVPVKEMEEAQVYACPNHPDQTSIDPNAVCPICGAKLEPVKEVEEKNEAGESETDESESGENEQGESETESGE